MSLLLLFSEPITVFPQTVQISTIEIVFSVKAIDRINRSKQKLRIDDITLINFLNQKFASTSYDKLRVIDGYPISTMLTLPTISVEHDLSSNKNFEFGKHTMIKREYLVDVFARTKGERDDLVSILQSFTGLEMTTEDNRVNTISDVYLVQSDAFLGFKSAVHNDYYFLRFDGTSTYAIIPNDSETIDGSIAIDMDIEIKSQTIAVGDRAYIFDKFDEENIAGVRVYIDRNYVLYVEMGLNTIIFTTSYNLSAFIDQRIRLTIFCSVFAPKLKCNIFVDAVAVKQSTAFIFLNIEDTFKEFTIGAKQTTEQEFVDFCELDLYGLVIGTAMTSPNARIHEKYLPRMSTDYVYFTVNEGIGNTIFNRTLDTIFHADNPLNMVAYGDYEWILYLAEIGQDETIKQSIMKMILTGID